MRLRSIITGAVGGFASGLTGVGGGTVMVPLLTGLLGMPQHRAHATSLFIVIFVGLSAVSLYVVRGEIEWPLAAALAVGGIAGAQVGTRLMYRLPDRGLRAVFATFLLAMGLRLLVLG